MEYQFQPREFLVGSDEYKVFRKWLWSEKDFPTQLRITSLKSEYLNEYITEYIALKHEREETKR